MNLSITASALAPACLFAMFPANDSAQYVEQAIPPKPMLTIVSEALPQYVSIAGDQHEAIDGHQSTVSVYHELRKGFGLSHTQMAGWLGLKRRSLYNWLDNQDSCRKKHDIEQRLANLKILFDDMDTEHRSVIYTLAVSPINGDPKFGADISSGVSSDALLKWYDMLYDRFEAQSLAHS